MINIFLCWKHKVVSEDQIKEFVNACVSAVPSGDPEDIFQEVCKRDDGTKVLFFGLAAIKKNKVNGRARLSSTVKTDTFHRFLLARSFKTARPGLVSKVLDHAPRTPDEAREYVDELRKITSTAGWSEPGATLGKPFPEPLYCWFTLTTSLARSVSKKSPSVTKATEARDALGLIDSVDGEHRLEISFPAKLLKSSPDLITARPTFADGGNSRFAAFQDGTVAQTNNSRGWGTTVHLEKLAKGDRDLSGLPERVSNSVPVSPTTFTATYLGRVEGTRGLFAADDHATFEARLRGTTTVSEIVELLTKAVTG
ncbi:MAG TPA: hypothetical protein VNX26_06415 [Candidatus Acidoferrum sp.]|jgi:hypothetical protein|nr:hypothetical protein [Candidatus Acidoferrum sp.]